MTDNARALARTVEPGPLTYLWRRAAVTGLLAATVATVTLAGTSLWPGLSADPASTSAPATSEQALSPDEATTPEPEATDQDPAATGDALGSAPATGSGAPGIDPGAPGEPGASPTLPPRTSRAVPQAPERVLDTRRGDQQPPPAGTPFTVGVEPPATGRDRTAVALAISLVDATGEGSVLVDGGSGVVEAVLAGEPGTTTSNLVVVAMVGPELMVRSSAGGHLVVDVVATFESSAPSASGRLVTTEPTRIAHLVTENDGRETDLVFSPVVPIDEAAAVLVEITADVGADGGVIRLGPSADQLDQMLMWGPAGDRDRDRRGLALLQPGGDGTAFGRYDGGTELTVEVIGYVTNARAEVSIAGLYVPAGPRLLHQGELDPANPVVVGGLLEGAATALVTVGSRSAIPGQLGSLLLPIDDGSVTLRPLSELDATVALLGVFLDS